MFIFLKLGCMSQTTTDRRTGRAPPGRPPSSSRVEDRFSRIARATCTCTSASLHHALHAPCTISLKTHTDCGHSLCLPLATRRTQRRRERKRESERPRTTPPPLRRSPIESPSTSQLYTSQHAHIHMRSHPPWHNIVGGAYTRHWLQTTGTTTARAHGRHTTRHAQSPLAAYHHHGEIEAHVWEPRPTRAPESHTHTHAHTHARTHTHDTTYCTARAHSTQLISSHHDTQRERKPHADGVAPHQGSHTLHLRTGLI